MKKKLSFIFLIVVLLFSINIISYAKSSDTDSKANIEVFLEGADAIKEGDSTYTLTLKLGDFTEVEENNILGFEAILEYNENLFTEVSITGKNNWTVTYSGETKKIIGYIDESKANTEIAELTFTIKDNVTVGTTGDIVLNEFIITDDQEIEREIKNVEKKGISVVSANEEKTNIEKTPSVSEHSQSSIAGNQDKTTARTGLPKTGPAWIVIIVIIIAVIFGIIHYLNLKVLKMKLKGKL